MPLLQLLPPIALATIVNVFLFALAWKQHQAELRTGKYSWPLLVGTTLYGSSIGAFLYLRMDKPVGSHLDHFMMALVAEAMGALVTYGLLNALVLTKGKLIGDRVFYLVASLGLLALLIGAAFQ